MRKVSERAIEGRVRVSVLGEGEGRRGDVQSGEWRGKTGRRGPHSCLVLQLLASLSTRAPTPVPLTNSRQPTNTPSRAFHHHSPRIRHAHDKRALPCPPLSLPTRHSSSARGDKGPPPPPTNVKRAKTEHADSRRGRARARTRASKPSRLVCCRVVAAVAVAAASRRRRRQRAARAFLVIELNRRDRTREGGLAS